MPNIPEIIVKEAIQAYAKNDGYWLKLCQFGDDIDISVLNKLEKQNIVKNEKDGRKIKTILSSLPF